MAFPLLKVQNLLICSIVALLCVWTAAAQTPFRPRWAYRSGPLFPSSSSPLRGLIGEFASSFTPGSRHAAAVWHFPNEEELWVYGGATVDASNFYSTFSDMWKLDLRTFRWAFMGGNISVDVLPNWGIKGTASAAGSPGGRILASSWVDSVGDLWLFGGYISIGYQNYNYNDLWRFSRSTLLWTWMGGPNAANDVGNFGSRGVSAPSNWPSARYSVAACEDPGNGFVWFFGGRTYLGSHESYNDLWRLDLQNYQWTWMSGSNVINDLGNYGQQGVAGSQFFPAARSDAVCWMDTTRSEMWIFGGGAIRPSPTPTEAYSDVWKISLTSMQWTWIAGPSASNQNLDGLISAPLGTPSTSSVPAPRQGGSKWFHPPDELWIWGGFQSANNFDSFLNDLWVFNTSNRSWTWYGGARGGARSNGNVGIASTSFRPDQRYQAITWYDPAKGLGGIFGGFFRPSPANFADQWLFLRSFACENTLSMINGSVCGQFVDGQSVNVSIPSSVPSANSSQCEAIGYAKVPIASCGSAECTKRDVCSSLSDVLASGLCFTDLSRANCPSGFGCGTGGLCLPLPPAQSSAPTSSSVSPPTQGSSSTPPPQSSGKEAATSSDSMLVPIVAGSVAAGVVVIAIAFLVGYKTGCRRKPKPSPVNPVNPDNTDPNRLTKTDSGGTSLKPVVKTDSDGTTLKVDNPDPNRVVKTDSGGTTTGETKSKKKKSGKWLFPPSTLALPEWELKRQGENEYRRLCIKKGDTIIHQEEWDSLVKLMRTIDVSGSLKHPDSLVAEAWALVNDSILSTFASAVSSMSLRHDRTSNIFKKTDWMDRNDAPKREEILKLLKRYDESVGWTPDGSDVCIVPVFAGTTNVGSSAMISYTNFAAVAKTDDSYYGRGIYSTRSLAYSASYSENTAKNQAVVLVATVCMGNTYPVLERSTYFLEDSDEEGKKASLTGKPINAGYQSHYVVVTLKGDVCNDPNRLGLDPYVADELVVAESTQIFPKYMLLLNRNAIAKSQSEYS